MPRLIPGQTAPSLVVELTDGGRFDLSNVAIDRFLLIDFYRGLHCPRCHRHILDLQAKTAHFLRRGVSVLALSMDDRERAVQAKADWRVSDVPFGYGLTLEQARDWDLYVSASISEREPSGFFTEPATFLIAPDLTVYSAILNSTPFARFGFADMLEGIETIIQRDYPPRGTVDVLRSLSENTKGS